MDAGIGEIAVHAVNFRQIGAAALRADVHLELLISAVVAVSQRQVDAFVQAELHGAAHQRADGFLVVADGVADVLNLSAVGEVPETRLAVLLLNRRDLFGDVAVEGIGDVWPVGHVFHNAVSFRNCSICRPQRLSAGVP